LNLLYFHTHDSGRYFRHYGYADAPGTFISRWALDSALSFRNAFTPAPTCSPSRAALLTGSYPHSSGMLGLAHRGFQLKDYRQHLASFLGEHGYHTVLSGVQHEAAACFDHAAGAAKIGYIEDITADLKQSDPDGDATARWDRENSLRAAEWLGRGGHTPFFLSAGMFATHREYPSGGHPGEEIDPEMLKPPSRINDSDENRRDHARFLKSLKQVDENFRIIMDALNKGPYGEDTLVLFTTDHGLALPFHKCNLNASGTGVALFMAVPGLPPSRPFSDALISTIDVFPTLCEVLGLPLPDHVEGESFAPCLYHPGKEHRDYMFGEVNFHTSFEPMRSVRSKSFSFIKNQDRRYPFVHLSNIDNSPPKKLLMSGGLGEIRKPSRELYHLVMDPLETVNLAEEPRYSATLLEMERLLADWQQRYADPLLQGEISPPPGSVVNRPECREPDSRNPDDYLPIATTDPES
jgi:N-sulfoglucosamine sulfohydrolase